MKHRETLLLTPGPSPVPPRVLERLAEPLIHHRTPEFRAMWRRVNEGLGRAFRTGSPVLTFASSGTGALEATITNLLGEGDEVLSFSSGKWGERYEAIAAAYGLKLVSFKYAYGESVRAADVREALERHPAAKAVLTTHCETSTGALQPIRQIAAETRRSGALLFVDAISGLGCDPLEMDAWGIDAVVGGSQKGLMLPPGLGFAALGKRALAIAESKRPRNFYFNFNLALEALKRDDSAFTPASNLVAALDESLAMILEEGLENVWERHAAAAAYVRRTLSEAGFATLAKAPSNALTAAVIPAPLSASAMLEHLVSRHGIVMAAGQGSLEGAIVRFAHMGHGARLETAERGLEAFLDVAKKDKPTVTVINE